MTDWNMTDWVRLAPADALPPGAAVGVDIDGERVALFHADGGYRALDDRCLHMGGPLSEGEVAGGTVTCPWHRWRYDLATGLRQDRRGQATRTYPVETRDGWLYLGLPHDPNHDPNHDPSHDRPHDRPHERSPERHQERHRERTHGRSEEARP